MMLRRVKHLLLMVLVTAASCSDGETDLAIDFQVPPGWETYYSSSGIVRLRKANTEADIDLSVRTLGPGETYADFESLLRQYSHVSLPSQITEKRNIAIGSVTGTRISFQGQRMESGVPIAGLRYLVEHNSKGYVFVYLGAGDQIDVSRREAQRMIEGIVFKK